MQFRRPVDSDEWLGRIGEIQGSMYYQYYLMIMVIIYIYIYIYIYIICRWIICWWIFLTNCWIARKRLVYKCLVWFYGISIIVGYLMPNALYIYIYIYIHTWLGLVWFHGISIIVGYLMPNALYIYIHTWLGLVWFHGISIIVGYLMPNALYIYIHTWLGLVWFHGISIIVGYLMPNALYIYTYMTWFWLISWYINYCGLFDAKCTIYIHTWLGLVWFHGISIIVGYLMPNAQYIYTYMTWFWMISWYINYCGLFDAKCTIYIHTWFGLVWFHGISIIVGYLMPNAQYIYIYIHD